MSDAQSNANGKIEGVMVGIVTNNDDPQNLGRVKLKLPMREMEDETDWARIATLFAGKERGSFFIPEVGDEVLVAFHLGEARQPYVIGMLWNQDNTPPANDTKIRKLTSQSGHEIIFDDTDSSSKVTIKSKKGQVIELNDQEDEIKISDQNDANSMIIDGSGKSITLKSGSSSITLDSSGVTIKSSSGITLKGGKIDISGNGVDVNSTGMLNVKSSGIASLKGSMVKIN